MSYKDVRLPNVWILVLILLNCAHFVRPNAMLTPAHRGLQWAKKNHVTTNYNYMEIKCGGIGALKRNQGECGLCGDPFDRARSHETGGKYSNGGLAKTYWHDERTIKVKILLNSDLSGYFIFHLCEANGKPETQACFDKNFLMVTEGRWQGDEYAYIVQKAGVVHLTLEIPEGLSCTKCVLQWKYMTSNTWGRDPDGTGCLGCGIQEQYVNCADIRIMGWGNATRAPTTTTIPPPPPPPRTTKVVKTVPPPPPRRITYTTRKSVTDVDEGTRRYSNGDNGSKKRIPIPPRSRPYTKPSAVTAAVLPAIPRPERGFRKRTTVVPATKTSPPPKPIPFGPNKIPRPPPSPSAPPAKTPIKTGIKTDPGGVPLADTGKPKPGNSGGLLLPKPAQNNGANPLLTSNQTSKTGNVLNKSNGTGITSGSKPFFPAANKTSAKVSNTDTNTGIGKPLSQQSAWQVFEKQAQQTGSQQQPNVKKTFNIINEYTMDTSFNPPFDKRMNDLKNTPVHEPPPNKIPLTRTANIHSEYGPHTGPQAQMSGNSRNSDRSIHRQGQMGGYSKAPPHNPRYNISPFDNPSFGHAKSTSPNTPKANNQGRFNTGKDIYKPPVENIKVETVQSHKRFGEFLSPMNKRVYTVDRYKNYQNIQNNGQPIPKTTKPPKQAQPVQYRQPTTPFQRIRQNENRNKQRINTGSAFRRPQITERFTNFQVGDANKQAAPVPNSVPNPQQRQDPPFFTGSFGFEQLPAQNQNPSSSSQLNNVNQVQQGGQLSYQPIQMPQQSGQQVYQVPPPQQNWQQSYPAPPPQQSVQQAYQAPPQQNVQQVYQAPPPQKIGQQVYQAPPPQQNVQQVYQAPPPQQIGQQVYQAPPPQQSGQQTYQTPPPQQNRQQVYQAPPPQQNRPQVYQAPPPQQNGQQVYQAPPPQQSGQQVYRQVPPLQQNGQQVYQKALPPQQNGQYEYQTPPLQQSGQQPYQQVLLQQQNGQQAYQQASLPKQNGQPTYQQLQILPQKGQQTYQTISPPKQNGQQPYQQDPSWQQSYQPVQQPQQNEPIPYQTVQLPQQNAQQVYQQVQQPQQNVPLAYQTVQVSQQNAQQIYQAVQPSQQNGPNQSVKQPQNNAPQLHQQPLQPSQSYQQSPDQKLRQPNKRVQLGNVKKIQRTSNIKPPLVSGSSQSLKSGQQNSKAQSWPELTNKQQAKERPVTGKLQNQNSPNQKTTKHSNPTKNINKNDQMNLAKLRAFKMFLLEQKKKKDLAARQSKMLSEKKKTSRQISTQTKGPSMIAKQFQNKKTIKSYTDQSSTFKLNAGPLPMSSTSQMPKTPTFRSPKTQPTTPMVKVTLYKNNITPKPTIDPRLIKPPSVRRPPIKPAPNRPPLVKPPSIKPPTIKPPTNERQSTAPVATPNSLIIKMRKRMLEKIRRANGGFTDQPGNKTFFVNEVREILINNKNQKAKKSTLINGKEILQAFRKHGANRQANGNINTNINNNVKKINVNSKISNNNNAGHRDMSNKNIRKASQTDANSPPFFFSTVVNEPRVKIFYPATQVQSLNSNKGFTTQTINNPYLKMPIRESTTKSTIQVKPSANDAQTESANAPSKFVKSTVKSFVNDLAKQMDEQIRLDRATGRVKSMPMSKKAIMDVLRKMAMNALNEKKASNAGSTPRLQKLTPPSSMLREVTVKNIRHKQRLNPGKQTDANRNSQTRTSNREPFRMPSNTARRPPPPRRPVHLGRIGFVGGPTVDNNSPSIQQPPNYGPPAQFFNHGGLFNQSPRGGQGFVQGPQQSGISNW